MPVFPGPVRHNNTQSPILDLTNLQVVGIGIFPNIAGRDALHANLQTDGYIATILDINKTFVYTGGGWTDTVNWSNVGGSVLPSGGSNDDILTRTGEGTAAWRDTLITKNITIKNHETNPGASEIVFSRKDTDGSTLQGDILGEMRAEGFTVGGGTRTGNPSIKFVSSGASSTAAFLESDIEFYVSNPSGTHKALELSSDRKVVLASIEDADTPTAVLGGIYYNSTQDDYFVGKVDPVESEFG